MTQAGRNQESQPGSPHGEDTPTNSVLFVCTGNTCRSPLAAAVFRRRLADRLACPVDDLGNRGWAVESAGLMATEGSAASPESAECARDLGADLSGHRSRPLSHELLNASGHVVVMTATHQELLERVLGRPDPRVRLLRADGSDLIDPIGGGEEVYRECAATIDREVSRLVEEWLSE